MEKEYYEFVSAKEEFGHNNEGFEFGVYWYNDPEGEEFADAQWFETEEERRQFILDNPQMEKVEGRKG